MKYLENYNSFFDIINEDTSATGGPSVGGMGAVVNSQPSSLPGTTTNPTYANTGGVDGSGDVSVPYNTGGIKAFQKIPIMGKNHGSMTGKKSRNKKIDMKAIKNIFAKKQDYTTGQGKSKVMDFDAFAKADINTIKK
jgi:hypothetical protein